MKTTLKCATLALLPLLFTTFPQAQAQIYKCQGNRVTVYHQIPCGLSAERLDNKPGFIGLVSAVGEGLRPGEKALLKEIAVKAQRRVKQAQQWRLQRRRQRQIAAREKRLKQQACYQARQRLTRVRSPLRYGYKPAQKRRLQPAIRRAEADIDHHCF